MSVTEPARTAARQAVPELRDLRSFRRVLGAVLMPIGPAVVAVLRLVAQDDTHLGERIAASQESQFWFGLAGWLVLFTLVPGAYAAVHLARRRRPVLAAWTGAFLIPGYLGMTALIAPEAAAHAGLAIGLSPQVASELAAAAYGAPGVAVPVLVFVLGHIVGVVLLGVLAIRARLLPVAFGVALAASQVVHLIATILGLSWLDFIGWGTTAVGMGLLGWRMLHTPDDEWDLPPEGTSGSAAGVRADVD